MSNELLIFSKQIRNAAKKLIEDNTKDKDENEIRINKELQLYTTFIRKFLSVKGNNEIFSKLTPLFENPRLKKPRNAILLMLEKNETQPIEKSTPELIMDLRRLLLRYGNLSNRYPAIKLLKEILNYGVVNGVPAFKRLLSIRRRLYTTFNSQAEEKNEK
ncbi:MAG: hypothetical protein PHF86_07305 [Candidatus Nanoarchaeia archaeon]|jgi:hypothetical protein|nr:hypothetical protein [Candidatus Nanoarchaeia archaeon]